MRRTSYIPERACWVQVECVPMSRNRSRRSLVLHKENQDLRGFSTARVLGDAMDIIWRFIEHLSWSQRQFLPAFHLHHHRTLQYVHKRVRVVPMHGRGRA